MLTKAELVLAPPGAHRDPARIARLIRDRAITTLHFAPSMLSAFGGGAGLRTGCRCAAFVPGGTDRGSARPFPPPGHPGRAAQLYGSDPEAAADVSY